MGTRGVYGFRKNGIDKITYNHFDSYPSWLGTEIVGFCKRCGVEKLNEICDRIELVSERSVPKPEQIEACKKAGWYNGSVSSENEKDWYCLLRNLQGNFGEYERLLTDLDCGYMTDSASFISDSLFCEYGYVIDLDKEVLEFLVGFQKVPQAGNRYGEQPDENGYYPCRLALTIPLKELETAEVEEIVKRMEQASEE